MPTKKNLNLNSWTCLLITRLPKKEKSNYHIRFHVTKPWGGTLCVYFSHYMCRREYCLGGIM
jgi:hypothetical protein